MKQPHPGGTDGLRSFRGSLRSSLQVGAIWAFARPFNAFWCLASVLGCCSSSRARSASSRLSWPRTSTAPVSSAVTVLSRSDSAGPPPAGQVRPLGRGQPHRAAQSGRPRPAEGPRRRGRGGPRPHGRQAQRRGRAHTGDKPGQCPDRDRARCVAVGGLYPRGFPPDRMCVPSVTSLAAADSKSGRSSASGAISLTARNAG